MPTTKLEVPFVFPGDGIWNQMLINTCGFILTHPLSGQTPVRSIARYFAWQARSRLTKAISWPWIEGTSLMVENGMTGATGNIYCGLHEFADMAFVLHLLRAGDVFLDIGANIGSYTVLASGVRKAKTIAFEPDPVTARHFLRNIEANRLQTTVTLHEVALGAIDGETAFTVGRDTVNRVATSTDEQVRTVRMRTLDGIGGTSTAILMKLDVEGYESSVLAGASEVLASHSLIAVETESQDPAVVKILESNDFRRAWYDPFRRELFDEPVAVKSFNALFVRNVQHVLERVGSAPKIRVLGVAF